MSFGSRSAFGYFWRYSVCVSLKLWLKESESCRIQESVCSWPACVCGLMLYLVQREMCRNTSGFSTALVSELKVLSCLLIQIFMHLFCIITMAKMSQDRFSLTFWSVIIIFCAPQCSLGQIFAYRFFKMLNISIDLSHLLMFFLHRRKEADQRTTDLLYYATWHETSWDILCISENMDALHFIYFFCIGLIFKYFWLDAKNDLKPKHWFIWVIWIDVFIEINEKKKLWFFFCTKFNYKKFNLVFFCQIKCDLFWFFTSSQWFNTKKYVSIYFYIYPSLYMHISGIIKLSHCIYTVKSMNSTGLKARKDMITQCFSLMGK